MLGRLAASEITSALTVNLASAVALANLFCRIFADDPPVICVSSPAAYPRCRARPCIARPRQASRLHLLLDKHVSEQ